MFASRATDGVGPRFGAEADDARAGAHINVVVVVGVAYAGGTGLGDAGDGDEALLPDALALRTSETALEGVKLSQDWK